MVNFLIWVCLVPLSGVALTGRSPNLSRFADVRLGEARIHDMGEVASLLVSSFFESLEPEASAVLTSREHARLRRHHGGERHVQLWARGADGTMVGFIDLDLRPKAQEPRPYISDLAVRPDYRRRHLATRLVKACEAICRHRYETDDLFLKVETSNRIALDMYAQLGYELHRCIDLGNKAVLRKRLEPTPPPFSRSDLFSQLHQSTLIGSPSAHATASHKCYGSPLHGNRCPANRQGAHVHIRGPL